MSSVASGTILVVDDNTANRYTIARLLRKEGFRILEASNGVEGLGRMVEEPDLLVVDVRMPEMDGYEVCRRIRADPRTRHLPILQISATYTTPSDVVAGLDGGADGYLTHPVDPGVLIATVRALLRARRAEDELRHSEARFRTLVTASTSLVWRADRAGQLVEVLPGDSAGQSAGYQHLAGGWLDVVHPDDTVSVRKAWTHSIATGESLDLECRLRSSDGSYRTVHCIAIPRRGADGALVEWLGTITDIHERRQAEEQVQRIQRMELVGRLAGGIAHETNNQMAVVLGLASYVAPAPNLNLEQRNDIEQIQRAAERVAHLTRQLLALSRRQVMQPEVVDLAQVVEESSAMLGRLLAPVIQVKVALEPSPLWVRADRTQLAQVILNLALNARDAMPSGGRLTLQSRVGAPPTSRGHLGRAWPSTQHLALLSVTDTGGGIEPSIRNRIFDPFFSTKGVGQGSGLGLSVVEGIVEQSGGDLWVESDPGAGTTFTIALPLVAPPDHPPSDAGADTPTGGNEALLVVEDEEAVRAMIARGLRQEGYRVIEAAQAGEALAILGTEHERIALVITDVSMPDMSGTELAKAVSAVSPGMPLIFVSGHPQETVFDEERLAGWGTFLQKPFTPEALSRAVRTVLDAMDLNQPA